MRREKLLVVAVDVDDDLAKAGIKTPVHGRDRVLEAAARFALHDPEDSDLNALFAAVKTADELRSKGYDAVPAAVAGSESGGIEASIRIREQLSTLLEETGASAVVVVTDGSEDETVIPVIESLAPIYAIRRVVVKQHRGVEETYILFAKYVKKALTEPRFSRLFLGVPGAVLVVFSALSLLGMLREAVLLGLLLLGLAMVIRGFELEDRIINVVMETPVSLIAYGTATLALLLAIGLLAGQLYNSGELTPASLAASLNGFSSLVGFAASIALFGHVLSKLISGKLRPGREALYVVTLAVAVILLDKISQAASLMETVSIGEMIRALVQVNFALYAIAGTIAVGITWRLARLLDAALESEEESERQGEEGEEASGRSAVHAPGTSREPGKGAHR